MSEGALWAMERLLLWDNVLYLRLKGTWADFHVFISGNVSQPHAAFWIHRLTNCSHLCFPRTVLLAAAAGLGSARSVPGDVRQQSPEWTRHLRGPHSAKLLVGPQRLCGHALCNYLCSHPATKQVQTQTTAELNQAIQQIPKQQQLSFALDRGNRSALMVLFQGGYSSRVVWIQRHPGGSADGCVRQHRRLVLVASAAKCLHVHDVVSCQKWLSNET